MHFIFIKTVLSRAKMHRINYWPRVCSQAARYAGDHKRDSVLRCNMWYSPVSLRLLMSVHRRAGPIKWRVNVLLRSFSHAQLRSSLHPDHHPFTQQKRRGRNKDNKLTIASYDVRKDILQDLQQRQRAFDRHHRRRDRQRHSGSSKTVLNLASSSRRQQRRLRVQVRYR